MTSFTPNFNLPKPDGTDLISAGFDAIDDLAEALDTLLVPIAGDTGWLAVGAAGQPAFANGWTNYGGGWAPMAYKRTGRKVALRGLVKTGTLNSTVFTLPVGFRPVVQHMLVGLVDGLDVTLASTGSAANVAPQSGVPSDNQTGSATAGGTAHIHGMANHTHSLGHSHPSVSVSGSANIGQAAVRIDVTTAGTVTPSGQNHNAFMWVAGEFWLD